MPPERNLPPSERREHFPLVSPNANYRMAYGSHLLYRPHHNEHDIDVYKGADSIFIESRGLRPDLFNEHGEQYSKYIDRHFKTGELSTAYKYAKQSEIPMFCIDAAHNFDKFNDKEDREIAIGKGEIIGAGLLSFLVYLDDHFHKQPSTSRKYTRRGMLLGAAYLSSGAPEQIADSLLKNDDPHYNSKFHKWTYAFNELMHPESNLNTLTVRNLVMAENAEAVSKMLSQKLGRKINATFPIGSAHVGIERDLLMDPEKRVQQIRSYFPTREQQILVSAMVKLMFAKQPGQGSETAEYFFNPNIVTGE